MAHESVWFCFIYEVLAETWKQIISFKPNTVESALVLTQVRDFKSRRCGKRQLSLF